MSYGRFAHEAKAQREQQHAAGRARTLRLATEDDPCTGWAPDRWPVLRAQLQEAVSEATWDLWLAGLHPHRMDGQTLVLGCPPHLVGWVGVRFASRLEITFGGKVRVAPCGDAA